MTECVRVGGALIHPRSVESVEVISHHYVNGSRHELVVHLVSGRTIRAEHGFGCDVWATQRAIETGMNDG